MVAAPIIGRTMPTWMLWVASFATCGIVASHFALNKTRLVNRQLDRNQRISFFLPICALLISYTLMVAAVGSIFAPSRELAYQFSTMLESTGRLQTFMFWIWCSAYRKRVASLARPGTCLHDVGLFVFHVFFVNHALRKWQSQERDTAYRSDRSYSTT